MAATVSRCHCPQIPLHSDTTVLRQPVDRGPALRTSGPWAVGNCCLRTLFKVLLFLQHLWGNPVTIKKNLQFLIISFCLFCFR